MTGLEMTGFFFLVADFLALTVLIFLLTSFFLLADFFALTTAFFAAITFLGLLAAFFLADFFADTLVLFFVLFFDGILLLLFGFFLRQSSDREKPALLGSLEDNLQEFQFSYLKYRFFNGIRIDLQTDLVDALAIQPHTTLRNETSG